MSERIHRNFVSACAPFRRVITKRCVCFSNGENLKTGSWLPISQNLGHRAAQWPLGRVSALGLRPGSKTLVESYPLPPTQHLGLDLWGGSLTIDP